jgi:microcystin degradation protein MlrC
MGRSQTRGATVRMRIVGKHIDAHSVSYSRMCCVSQLQSAVKTSDKLLFTIGIKDRNRINVASIVATTNRKHHSA